MSWPVTFADGPLAGREHDRTFMGRRPAELWFAPIENFGDGWALVGIDGLEPNPSWQRQAHYIRRPGEDCFELAPADAPKSPPSDPPTRWRAAPSTPSGEGRGGG